MESYAFGAFVVIAFAGLILALAASESSKERRIRAIEHRLALLLHHFGIDPDAHVPPSREVRRLAADPARKLQAIRLYCKETGADLKTSVAVINSLISGSGTT